MAQSQVLILQLNPFKEQILVIKMRNHKQKINKTPFQKGFKMSQQQTKKITGNNPTFIQ